MTRQEYDKLPYQVTPPVRIVEGELNLMASDWEQVIALLNDAFERGIEEGRSLERERTHD